ncbi:MAG TPA: Asp-tRNA(Asn)/Glu-tRNA(Gln) amidotransferase subunit GatA [Bacteroides sp.]|nr:Asp-tRNA(Asn)/Glu-tRNA(Gln) amidotransferase subunit GatA [Bacteroides sp.]
MKPPRSLIEIRKLLSSREVDMKTLVEFYLGNIREKKHLNAFIEVFGEEALERADRVQQKIDRGTGGRLAGMVIGLKDNICYKGHYTSASSRSLENFRSIYNATAVDRLLAEDAIIIGRTGCDEFAMGGTNETSYYGPVLNPLDTSRVPGGSSGGSAAAVAADLCLAAIGSDTGGSIRQPASFCGLTGLKPGYGRVSRYGLIAYGSSFDQIGPITHSIQDAALILEVIAGKDEYDSTARSEKVPEYSMLLHSAEGKKDGEPFPRKFAYLKEPLDHPGLDPHIRERTINIIEELRADGFQGEPVSFPYLDYMVPAYYVMATAEASSNLARYDGIHYGHRSENSDNLRSTYVKSRSEGFGTEVKRRIMTGTFVLSTGYYDAYYGKAQKARRLIHEKTMEIFDQYPFIILPTTPRPAFLQGSMGEDPVALYLEDIFTIHANLVGIPAISLPLGKHPEGMPFGLQIMSAGLDETGLLLFSDFMMNRFGSLA